MSTVIHTADAIGIDPVRLVMRPLLQLDENQFYQLVAQNRELALEQEPQGVVVILQPHGLLTSSHNAHITYQLSVWNKQAHAGIVFGSRTPFRFSPDLVRRPDAAWVLKSSWDCLTRDQQEKISPLVPNFVIELRCESDRLVDLQDKLAEYVANGVEVGWLIDPLHKQVHVYEAGQPVQVFDQPATVTGTGCVQGFVLDLREIFSDRD